MELVNLLKAEHFPVGEFRAVVACRNGNLVSSLLWTERVGNQEWIKGKCSNWYAKNLYIAPISAPDIRVSDPW